MADSRFTLRHGATVPGTPGGEVSDEILLNHELGYCDNGIIYSRDEEGKLTIVAQELKYGTSLPTNGA
jgi:hypothetical protein